MSNAASPAGWISTTLNEVVNTIVGGGTPSKSNPSYFSGSIPWMTVKDMNKHVLTDTIDHISDEAVENSSTNVIPAGIPIVATRMSLGKIVVASFDSAINQDLKAIFPSAGVDSNYFIYWYRSLGPLIESLGTGTTVKGIRLEVLKELGFPLAPLAEQREIANRLDTLLAQVDTLKGRLDALPDILKRFRQSVLAAAVSGKLTEEWREEKLSDLQVKKLGDTSIQVKTGPFGSALHKSDYLEGGFPVINPMHINDGVISPAPSMTVSQEKFSELAAWKLIKGDVVIGRRGEMGRAAVVKSDTQQLLCGTGSMILRAGDDVIPKYLELVLRSPTAIGYFNSASVGSTMVNLNQKVIKNLEVHFPPHEEQTEIVRRVEQLFAFADQVEQRVKQAQNRVNHLTQSILAKAFRGELTADWRKQHPTLISGEHSASALLTRIRAERAAQTPAKRTPRKKASA